MQTMRMISVLCSGDTGNGINLLMPASQALFLNYIPPGYFQSHTTNKNHKTADNDPRGPYHPQFPGLSEVPWVMAVVVFCIRK